MPSIKSVAAQFRPDVSRLVSRFPLPLLFAVAICAYSIVTTHKLLGGNRLSGELVGILLACFAWTLAAALFAQARGGSRMTGILAGAIGAAVLVLLGAYPLISDVHIPALIVGLTLAIAIAGYTTAARSNAAFWQFNHNLWIGAGIGALAGLLFFAGAAAILASLEYLFGLNIGSRLYADSAAIAFGLVGPIAWLSLVPERFDSPVVEGPQTEFTSYAVAALAKYLLVPLLLIYAVILHVYALKIGFETTLPKGRLGWMVLSYGGVVALTALLTFPTRDSGGVLVRLFWRIWPWLLLIPTVLLFLAITQRIGQYGFTELRYLVLLAGIWLLLLVVAYGLWPGQRDLRLMPGSLAALLLAASIGPWGLKGHSVRAQTREFISLLDSAGITQSGKLVDGPVEASRLLPSDAKRAESVVRYLNQNRRLDVLEPVFAGTANNPFKKDTDAVSVGKNPNTGYSRRRNWYPPGRYGKDYKLRIAIVKRLGINTAASRVARGRRLFLARAQAAVNLPGTGWITRTVRLFKPKGRPAKRQFTVGSEKIAVTFDGKTLAATHSRSGKTSSFDLAGNQKLNTRTQIVGTGRVSRRAGLVIARTAGDLDVRLVVLGATGDETDGGRIKWDSVRFFLVFADIPKP